MRWDELRVRAVPSPRPWRKDMGLEGDIEII